MFYLSTKSKGIYYYYISIHLSPGILVFLTGQEEITTMAKTMQDIAKHAGEGIFVSPWKFRFQNKVCLVCLVFHCKTDDGSRMTPKRFFIEKSLLL